MSLALFVGNGNYVIAALCLFNFWKNVRLNVVPEDRTDWKVSIYKPEIKTNKYLLY